MVSYCCVNGCGNTSKNKNKNPNSAVSFHVFPANKELRSKWLRAIGRPNWSPSNHARICSAHFVYDQINHDSCKIRIKDDVVPVLLLPLNSNFDASNVEACRICLATDDKLYSLRDTHLGACMRSIAGLSFNGMDLEDLPQYVCYLCAPSLIKCNQLIEKCMASQATLLDIFAKNGQISKDLIKEQNRTQPILKSLENSFVLNDYLLKCDDGDNTSLFAKTVFNSVVKDNNNFKSEDSTNTDADTHLNNKECQVEANETKLFEVTDDVAVEEIKMNSNGDPSKDSSSNAQKETKYESQVMHTKMMSGEKTLELTPDETNMLNYYNIVQLSLNEQVKEWEKSAVSRPLINDINLQCEICNKSFANVNTYRGHVTQHEPVINDINLQCEICNKSFANVNTYRGHVTQHEPVINDINLQCEICNKSFANVNTYRGHVTQHEPSYGRAHCHICKLRFKITALATSHAKRAHSKKFYCKMCPKAFNNVMVAKKHQRWHSGYLYKCDSCPFSTLHESSLGIHKRRAHANAHACALCGRAYGTRRGLDAHLHTAHRNIKVKDIKVSKEFRCEQCGIDFASEGARRIHILTSIQHRKKYDLCDTAVHDPNRRNICEKCGVECATVRELSWHKKSEHPRPRSKDHPSRGYPKDCEICGETLPNRKKHWHHVRKKHPENTDSYKRVQTITCICDTCGKGFQNSTKLRLHQLRHRSPSVRCPCCSRLFYDKYALAAHAPTHVADRPHQCRTCGAAFKQRCNLDRHYRVHSDVAAFECTICGKKFKYSTSLKLHVNYVHNKLPYPKRKKRIKSVKNASDS